MLAVRVLGALCAVKAGFSPVLYAHIGAAWRARPMSTLSSHSSHCSVLTLFSTTTCLFPWPLTHTLRRGGTQSAAHSCSAGPASLISASEPRMARKRYGSCAVQAVWQYKQYDS